MHRRPSTHSRRIATITLAPRPRAAGGFSLVELVVVIVILGVLAAFVVPRFLNLGASARIAAVNGLAGSLKSAVALVHGACVATPDCLSTVPEDKTVVLDGKTVALWSNYPNGGVPLGVASADTIVDASGFQVTSGGPSGFIYTIFTLPTAPDPTQCGVTYTEAANLTTPPVVTTLTGGC
jgi:MSHA pilin protein MshA